MRLHRQHRLVREHGPSAVRKMIMDRHVPTCTYLRQGQQPSLWPQSRERPTMVLVVVPGQRDDAWPREWMAAADEVVVVDATGRDVALLKGRNDELFDHRQREAA